VASVALNISVTILKLTGAFLTGSVSLLSDAVHSGTDLIASSLTYVSVRVAGAPPDEEHPFGHGKIESLTGFVEAIMIFVVVAFIGLEAINRLLSRHVLESKTLGFGLLAMGISSVASLIASFYVKNVGNRTGSVALKVNARHLQIDFFTSLGVFVGLAATQRTGKQSLDPIIALVLAVWLCYGAVRLAVGAFQEIIDVRLPEKELAQIRQIVAEDARIVSHHRLRTRRSGSVRNIDLHIVVPRDWNVVEAHEVADALEHRIREELAPAEVVVHIDPFDPDKAKQSLA
jgi:cation diffusion facilitator family transporter